MEGNEIGLVSRSCFAQYLPVEGAWPQGNQNRGLDRGDRADGLVLALSGSFMPTGCGCAGCC
jgi:hypothetical protein